MNPCIYQNVSNCTLKMSEYIGYKLNLNKAGFKKNKYILFEDRFILRTVPGP